MFAIYNLNGRTFRNSLEKLRVHQPHAVQSAHIHSNTAQDETLAIQGNSDTEIQSPQPLVPSEIMANAKSLAAYRQMLHANDRTAIVHAYQVMSHPVEVLQATDTLAQALNKFEQNGYQQMPIQSPQLQLIGLVTFQELIFARFCQAMPENTLVSNLIHQEVISADPISDIRRVAKVLYEYERSALPVMNEHDHLVGIVSKTDILKALMTDPPLSLWT